MTPNAHESERPAAPMGAMPARASTDILGRCAYTSVSAIPTYGDIPRDCACGGCDTRQGPPDCRYAAWLAGILGLVAGLPIADRCRLFGSAAAFGDRTDHHRQRAPGDLDVIVDFDQPAWAGRVWFGTDAMRAAGFQQLSADDRAVLRTLQAIALRAYGSFDPFARVNEVLYVRTDHATGYMLSANPLDIWAAARATGVIVRDVTQLGIWSIAQLHAWRPAPAA